MKNTVIAVVAAILLLALGYFVWTALSKPIVPPSEQTPPVQMKSTYATSTFSIQYPSDYAVNENYAYDQFEKKPITGVKFTVPESLSAGTNLSSFDTGVSVEWLPRAQKCTGDIYVPANVKAMSLTFGSTTYSLATTSGAAAGNIYEELVYAIQGSKPCTALRYLIHSTNIGNYSQEGEGSVREFDRGALIRAFDEIRNSLVLNQ